MIPLWAFVAVTVPLVLAPGASTAVVLRNSIAGGTRAGIQTAIGINAGSCFYGCLTAFGVALLLQEWPGVWSALRAGGMVYLAWLGVQSVRRAIQPARGGAGSLTGVVTAPDGSRATLVGNLREGFVTNALNPAIATFYFIIVPQFVPAGASTTRSILILTVVHVALAASWHMVWAAAGGTLARSLGGGWPRRLLDLLAGAALLWLAARLAL